MLALVYCRYASHELITVKPIKQDFNPHKMYDKLTTGNSTLLIFCFYKTLNALYLIRDSQRWAQITLYQKRNATKRNDLFNQQKRTAKCAI